MATPEVEQVLDRLEQEVSREEGIRVGPQMSTRDAGRLGGHMVRKLIERAKAGGPEGQVLRQLEDEAKRELGITQIGPDMTTEEAGRLGGYMVKRMIERAEREMARAA